MNRNLVLKASAGTGKTYRLSLEFIYSLASGIDFKDILVMTFTKKATSEIKERILNFLKSISENSDKKNELEQNIQKIYGEDFHFEISKMRYLYKHINENRDKLKIYTIDSFTNTIFKRAVAPYLKIYNYEIIDDEENKKIHIKTFQRIFENREDFSEFKEFLEDNSERDMEKYIDLIKKIVEQRWKLLLIKDVLEKKEKFPAKSSSDILDKIIEVLTEVMIIKKQDNLESFLKKDCQGYLNSQDKESFLKENFKIFLKDKIWSGVKVKSKKGDIDSHLADLNYLDEQFKNSFAKEMFNVLVLPYEEKLLKVVEKICTIYDEIKFREKKFTHTDLSIYTYRYLENPELGFIDENGLTDEFFEVIEGRFRNIFIDEFQDTSILQWKILKNIIDKSDRTICVGDEKQSIYGWRGGEKKLFENLYEIIDSEVEELDTCFRSKKNIIISTNSIFSMLSQESNQSLSSQWNFTEVKYKSSDDDGYLKVIKGEENSTSLEQMVAEIKNNFSSSYSEIGILARNKKVLTEIAIALSENGIPFIFESDADIIESREIQPLYALICWLVKQDFLSLLDFLRSELIKFSASQLKYFIENRENIENYLYDVDSSLEGREDILKTLKNLYKEYQLSNGKTYFLTYDIFQTLGIVKKFENEENISTLFQFFRLLKSYEYFSEFLVEYEENSKRDKFKKISRDNSDGVSLMTIHKSKGLEFNTVFYYLPKKSNNRADTGMEFYLDMDKNYSKVNSYLITDNKFNTILENIPEINYLRDSKLKKEHEELNNLYVALTRAKSNLFIVIENPDDSYLTLDILKKVQNLGKLLEKNEKIKTEETPMDFKVTLSSPEVKYKKELDENTQEAIDKIYSHTLQLESKRVRGSAVHYFLENILSWKKEEIALAKELTINRYISILGESEIKTILSDKNIEYIYSKCNKIFNEKWDFVYCEYPIYPRVNGEIKTLRLDRLMIKLPKNGKKGIIYIADYKTGKHDEEQMENYKFAITQLLEKSGESLADYEIKSEFIIL